MTEIINFFKVSYKFRNPEVSSIQDRVYINDSAHSSNCVSDQTEIRIRLAFGTPYPSFKTFETI